MAVECNGSKLKIDQNSTLHYDVTMTPMIGDHGINDGATVEKQSVDTWRRNRKELIEVGFRTFN